MTITIDWGDAEECVLVMRFSSKWTGDEFIYSLARLQCLWEGASKQLELMIDLRSSVNPPNNLITLLASSLKQPRPKDLAQVVIISNFGFWKQMFRILCSSYPDKIHTPIVFVDSVDEAYMLINCLNKID